MDQYARTDLAQFLAAAEPLLDVVSERIWIAYELIRKKNGRLDKKPLPGFRTNDPSSWVSLGEAVAIAENHPIGPEGPAGVGFIVVAELITFDLDDCIDEDGTVAPEVAAIIERFDSFGYVTVSGTGMRVVVLNDEQDPIAAGYYVGHLPGGHKVEVFVGPTNHFNTFSAATNGKPLAVRTAVARALLDEIDRSGGSDGTRQTCTGASGNLGEFGRTSDLGKEAKDPKDLISALKAIPPDFSTNREEWVKLAGGFYAGMGSTGRGRKVFLRWCEGWQDINDSSPEAAVKAERLWDSFGTSPPRAVGAGTVFALAKQHGWTRPKKAKPAGDDFTFLAPEDMELTEAPDFVEELLLEDSLVVVFGPPTAGKTFLVVDLLLHVALGRTWFGRAVDQGPALLFALEGRRGVVQRVMAFFRRYRLDKRNVPFRMSDGPVDLLDKTAVDKLITAIKAQGAALGAPIKVVAVDTLMTALGSGHENSAETMGPVLTNCHRIRRETGGCCVILIHHPGKDGGRGPRGFSGIVGTIDTLIEIQHPDQTKPPRRVIIRKQRDLELTPDFYYRLRPVDFGKENRRGKSIMSGVVVPITDPAEVAAAKAQTVKLTDYQRVGLDALRDALQQQEETPAGKCPAERATTQTAWRTAFTARLPAGTLPGTIKQAFKRMQQVLIRLKLVGTDGKQVWLIEDIEAEEDDL